MTVAKDDSATDAGFQLSLKLHHELEALYPRIEQHGALFRDIAAVDRALPRPPGKTSGVQIDPVVCALATKAATTKRAILALCELGDGDNAIALARVMLENACLLEWLIRGEGRRRLEAYVMFLSVIHERVVETVARHSDRFGYDSTVSSSPHHRAVWTHTFRNLRGDPTTMDRPTWELDPTNGRFEAISVKRMFKEIAGGTESFEYDVLYGAIGSDIVHSGPFGLGRVIRELEARGRFVLRAMPGRGQCTIALASSNQAMFLVIESLTEYIGLDLSAELAPMKARGATDPYTHTHGQHESEGTEQGST